MTCFFVNRHRNSLTNFFLKLFSQTHNYGVTLGWRFPKRFGEKLYQIAIPESIIGNQGVIVTEELYARKFEWNLSVKGWYCELFRLILHFAVILGIKDILILPISNSYRLFETIPRSKQLGNSKFRCVGPAWDHLEHDKPWSGRAKFRGIFHRSHEDRGTLTKSRIREILLTWRNSTYSTPNLRNPSRINSKTRQLWLHTISFASSLDQGVVIHDRFNKFGIKITEILRSSEDFLIRQELHRFES